MNMEPWILFTLFAAVMQSVRTAGQKQIIERISVQAATLVRFLFGIKFAAIYFICVSWIYKPIQFEVSTEFFLFGALASVAQVLATICLINVLNMKNFAVGTSLAKTEAILTAILGALFFASTLSVLGYVSVFIGSAGLVVASRYKITDGDKNNFQSLVYGLCAGLGFALASFWIRGASLSLDAGPIPGAAAVLLYMVVLQSLICLFWVAIKEPEQLHLIKKNVKGCLFIGFTGVAGSVGWFTAMSLQNPALVRTLGQIEFVISLLITYLYFNERVSRQEYLGIILIALSVFIVIRLA